MQMYIFPNVEEIWSNASKMKLPEPKGYKILLAVAKMQEKKGAIFLPNQYVDLENTAAVLGLVVAKGPDAYADTKKFPTGPWCSVGNHVMFKVYSGTRFRVGEQEYRLVNDDQIEAVCKDFSEIERI